VAQLEVRPRPLTVLMPRSEKTIVTIQVIMRSEPMSAGSWTVAEAKAKFSEVIDRAELRGPQVITKHGRTAVVIV